MAELVAAVAAVALWLAGFAVLIPHAKRWTKTWSSAVLVAYPVFCALQVVIAKALSRAQLLTTVAIATAYAIGISLGLALLLRRRTVGPPENAAPTSATSDGDTALVRRVVFGAVALVLVGVAGFSLIAPVFVWDTLAYHMPMIASYVQNGSLDSWPTQDLRQVYRVNAGELQLLNIGLLSASDAWVEFANVLALAVVLLATLELARLALRNRALPYLVVALVLSAPQILVGAVTAKNDLMFLAVVLGAFYWMIRAATDETGPAVGFAAVAGFSVAIAAATKVMGLNVLGAIGLLGLVLMVRRRLPFTAVVSYSLAAAFTLVVLVGDIYWENFTRAAVPVGVAPDEVYFTAGVRNFVLAAEYYLWELPLRRLLVLQLFEHDQWHYGYLYPFVLVLGCAAAVRHVVKPNARQTALSALALIGAAILFSVIAVRMPISSDHRFMSWLVPVLAILAVSWAERWDGRRILVLTTVAASFAMMHLFQTFTNEMDGLFTRSATHLASTGSLARYADVPARRYLGMIEGFDALDRAEADDSVLYVGSDDAWMYAAWGPRYSRRVRGVESAADAAEQVASGQFRFVVIEAAARAELREAALDAARKRGYEPVAEAEQRVVLERPAASSVQAGPSDQS